MQMMFEFGPLWLVAAGVATAVFGPYTAGMTASSVLAASSRPGSTSNVRVRRLPRLPYWLPAE
jgi:hypothetical protein